MVFLNLRRVQFLGAPSERRMAPARLAARAAKLDRSAIVALDSHQSCSFGRSYTRHSPSHWAHPSKIEASAAAGDHTHALPHAAARWREAWDDVTWNNRISGLLCRP